MVLALPAIDGKYEIVAKIKEGGMGAIYKVRHRLLDEIRVVKVLRPQFEDDRELKERFAREARAAIKLRHPNVVHIFDFSLDDEGGGLIVMEFIQGVDLNQLIAAKNLPSTPLALEMFRQSLRALGFLHQHGFVHRDVSPDNLMLTLDVEGRPLIKLIDLGIAKRHDAPEQLTVGGSFLGKFRYASPEHFGSRGPNGIEARSDLYTFGLVFYELLTGAYPFAAQGTSQLIASHLFQSPLDFATNDPSGRVPEVLRRMALRALAKNPDERQRDAVSWIAEIEELQRHQFPLGAREIAEARRLCEVTHQAAVGPQPLPGSTQHRLDRSFDQEPTPRPQLLEPSSEDVTHISSAGQLAQAASAFDQRTAMRSAVEGVIRQAEMAIDVGQDQEAIAALKRAQSLIHDNDPLQQELGTALLRLARKVQDRPAQNELRTEGSTFISSDPDAMPPDATPGRLEALDANADGEEVEPLVGGLLAALAEIEKFREEGRILAAWKLLKLAIASFGEIEPLPEIRQELARELLADAHN